MPCSNRTKVRQQPYPMPAGRRMERGSALTAVRATLRIPLGLSLLVLLLLSCSAATAIVYELQPEVKDPAPGGRKILRFDAQRMFRVSERGNGIEMDLIFLRKETLKDIANRISEEHIPLRRVPEIFPVRFHIFNYGDKRYRFDAYKFRVRSTKTKETYAALMPLEYQNQYYSDGSAGLPFYWAFEQKDSFQFLHPLPDWYLASRGGDTGSAAEHRQLLRKSVERILETHPERTKLPPGRELKGYLLFPELPAGSYVLESVDTAPDRFPFRTLAFDVKFTYAENHEVEKTADDKRAFGFFQQEIVDVEREIADFHAMHRQLRLHDELKNSTTGK